MSFAVSITMVEFLLVFLCPYFLSQRQVCPIAVLLYPPGDTNDTSVVRATESVNTIPDLKP